MSFYKDIDLITVGPAGQDFPYYRYFVQKNRHLFNNVYYVFNNSFPMDDDVVEFFKEDLKDCDVWVEQGSTDPYDPHIVDWRQSSTIAALKKSKSKYVCFLEQDFLVQNVDTFLPEVYDNFPDTDCVTFIEGGLRIWVAAFSITKRSILNQTELLFSAQFEKNEMYWPRYDVYDKEDGNFSYIRRYSVTRNSRFDHFDHLSSDLIKLGVHIDLLNEKMTGKFNHLASTTINLFRFMNKLTEAVEDTYKPKEFLEYVKMCMSLPIKRHPSFEQSAQTIIEYYENIS